MPRGPSSATVCSHLSADPSYRVTYAGEVHAADQVRGRSRSDATRNRVRVVDAAVDVFAKRGVEATVAEVAAQAGVGNATVFRNFPTKDDLIGAVTSRWFADWRLFLEASLADDGSADVLHRLVRELFERLRTDRLALDLLRLTVASEELAQMRSGVSVLFDQAIDRGVRAGLVAASVTYDDLSVLVLGIAGRLAERDDDDPDRWQRFGDYVWSAVCRSD
jgi:AcrR family transcriptional regulator